MLSRKQLAIFLLQKPHDTSVSGTEKQCSYRCIIDYRAFKDSIMAQLFSLVGDFFAAHNETGMLLFVKLEFSTRGVAFM